LAAVPAREDWAADTERRAKADVPDGVRFATKTQIALEQLRTLLEEGTPRHCVLADAGYGVDNAFRQALSDMGLLYAVGVTSAVVVLFTRVQSLPPDAFQAITWREGANTPLRERFAAVRVRHAGGNVGKARLRPEQWLLIEWPASDEELSKYFLSTLSEDTTISELVSVAHRRWCIERDYQDLKRDFGLGHYEGRGWRGFHHRAALSIAVYGFLMAERLVADKSVGG
jgi:SRSO17 transposase